jgi:OFA family oxalate/formate antiporter-like MFS transporter
VYVIACLFLLRSAQNSGEVLSGPCIVGFAHGGYLALSPSFTTDYFGAKNVGANYGILFTAWGVCGFTVPKYLAGIMDAARAAGDPGAGYTKVYVTLTFGAAVSIALMAIVKRLLQEIGAGESEPICSTDI